MATVSGSGFGLTTVHPPRRARWSAARGFVVALALAPALALTGCLSVFGPGLAGSPENGTVGRRRPVSEVAAAAVNADVLARDTFNAVNVERLARHLPPLQWDEAAAAVARRYAFDLVAMGRLDHRGANGSTLKNRIAGLRWVEAGENLARNKGYADPVAQAVKNWIQSTGHARNLYSPRFRLTGLGVARTPDGFHYFVQIFLVPPLD